MPCCGAYMGLLCQGCAIYDTPEGRKLLFGDDWEDDVEPDHSESAVSSSDPRSQASHIGPLSAGFDSVG